MVAPMGLLLSLGSALNGTARLMPWTAAVANLNTQGWRCLSAATVAKGADAADTVRPDLSAPETGSERGADSGGHVGSLASSRGDGANSSNSSGGGSGPGFNVEFRRVVSDRRTADQGAMEGVVHIQNTFNNIILTLTDHQGFIKTYTSAGIVGFRGARRSQPVAAERAAEELAKRALKLGYSTVSIRLKGPGNTKQYAVQSLAAAGLQIKSLADVTPIPYNGCRLPKRRRV